MIWKNSQIDYKNALFIHEFVRIRLWSLLRLSHDPNNWATTRPLLYLDMVHILQTDKPTHKEMLLIQKLFPRSLQISTLYLYSMYFVQKPQETLQSTTYYLSSQYLHQMHHKWVINCSDYVRNTYIYRQVSNISRTKSQHLEDSRTVLRLSLRNPLKPDVKSRMEM